MKLSMLQISNFRSFENETIHLNDYNCFVGPNGSGKSTILTALNILFRNPAGSADIAALSEEDFHLKNTNEPIVITATFTDISGDAKEELKAYVRQNRLVVKAKAVWNPSTRKAEVMQYGARFVMKEFAQFFEAKKQNAKAPELKLIYKDLSEVYSDLPKANTKDDMENALRDYEEAHPDLCTLQDSPDQFYGWTKGTNRLAAYCQWVYIPAVKDVADEQQEGKNTALGSLLQRTIRSKVSFEEQVKGLKDELGEKYRLMIGEKQAVLESVSESVQLRLREWAHPDTRVNLQWQFEPEKSVAVLEPVAHVQVGEGNFLGEIPRMGHGLQRSFLVSLLQELAETHEGGQPTLILGFEEPELYQHPPQARHLAFVLEQLSQDNAQVLVTTHSPYFVSGKGFESVRMTRRSGKDAVTMVSHVTPEELSKALAAAMGEPPTPPSSVMAAVEQIMQPSQNELFFSRVPVLVEGIEDIAYISTHLKLAGRWSEFRRLGCHFVVGGGKNSMSRPLAIAVGLNIAPFVVFDGDGDRTTEMANHRRDNGCLLYLCGHASAETFPAETLWGDRVVMWATDIERAVKLELGEAAWIAAQDQARRERGLTDGVGKKNALLISATLETLRQNGKTSKILDRLCNSIITHAQRVSQ